VCALHGLSPSTRKLIRTSAATDLSFGIAAAHLLARRADRLLLDRVLELLSPYSALPDVAILCRAHQRHPTAVPTAPPLLRASMQLVMTNASFDLAEVEHGGSLARAACRGYADSVWCTWSHDSDDEQWIAATLAELSTTERDPVALGRMLGVPPRSILRALDALAAMPDRR
jgi:hypothetical protein